MEKNDHTTTEAFLKGRLSSIYMHLSFGLLVLLALAAKAERERVAEAESEGRCFLAFFFQNHDLDDNIMLCTNMEMQLLKFTSRQI